MEGPAGQFPDSIFLETMSSDKTWAPQVMAEHFSTAIHKATMQFSLFTYNSLNCRPFWLGKEVWRMILIAQKCLHKMPHCKVAFAVSRTWMLFSWWLISLIKVPWPVWIPDPSGCVRKRSRELPIWEVSCWNAKVFKSCKLISRILNVIGQVLFQSS